MKEGFISQRVVYTIMKSNIKLQCKLRAPELQTVPLHFIHSFIPNTLLGVLTPSPSAAPTRSRFSSTNTQQHSEL